MPGVVRVSGVCLLTAGILWGGTACDNAGSPPTFVTKGQLLGTWSAASGARMTLSADHTFTATGLDLTVLDAQCSSLPSGAKWEFVVPLPGDSSGNTYWGDASAARGQSFAVDLGSGQSPSCPG